MSPIHSRTLCSILGLVFVGGHYAWLKNSNKAAQIDVRGSPKQEGQQAFTRLDAQFHMSPAPLEMNSFRRRS